MLTGEYQSDADFVAERLPQGGVWLDTSVIVDKLRQADSRFHADPGARLNIWHPDQSRMQGLYYWQKHLCSMDRGLTPQWPEWSTVAGLSEVGIDYAMTHEDFPVLSLVDKDNMENGKGTALIERPCIDDVKRIGWAEVFWHVINHRVPGIDAHWFAKTFRVDMAWMAETAGSPLSHTFRIALDKGMVSL